MCICAYLHACSLNIPAGAEVLSTNLLVSSGFYLVVVLLSMIQFVFCYNPIGRRLSVCLDGGGYLADVASPSARDLHTSP
eukprot:gene13319-9155_t